MESLVSRIFFYQWQKKLVALVTALVIWIFVSHTITSTVIIPSVPVRVINVPADKAVIGLLPNGFMSKRITLTLTGTKDVIEQLEPGDLEVLLDVANNPNEGLIQITKKNLVSLNPTINLTKHVNSVSHPEIMLKMSPLVKDKIPVTINPPTGTPPNGYEYVDFWPTQLMHTVTGPEEEVLKLKKQGLELTFRLDNITNEQLEALPPTGSYDDEITFYIPDNWKKISIPFLARGLELLNAPETKYLQISFLKKQFIPVKAEIPVHVFYTFKYSSTINPGTYKLSPNQFVVMKNDIPIFEVPVLTTHVSRPFVDIIKDNIEIQIVTSPRTERERLQWGIGFMDENYLEDTYVAYALSNSKITGGSALLADRENHFRTRFREYMQKFALYLSSQEKLSIEASLEAEQIRLHVPNALFTFPGRISIRRETPDVGDRDEGIAVAIAEEQSPTDGRLAADRKLTEKVNKGIPNVSIQPQ